MKYIIRKIPCYLDKSCIGELEPVYDYGTHIDNYYEEFDEMVIEFANILKNKINYDIHNVWTHGVSNDDIYMIHLIFFCKSSSSLFLSYIGVDHIKFQS